MKSRRIVIFGWAESAHVQRWALGLKERGYLIRVISLGGEPIEGVDTVIIPRRGRLAYLAQAGTAAGKALDFSPDLIHVHYAGGFGLWGTQCGFSPLLVSVWGTDIIDSPGNVLLRLLVRRTLRRADYISATSDLLKRTCLKLVPDAAGKITVIPFGVQLPDIVVPLPESPVRACFIKRHRRKYGPDVLLKAMVQVLTLLPDIKLTVAGKGEMTPTLKAQVARLGLERNVEFVGQVDNRDIYSLLAQHHIMVMPSVTESFGVAALEASACGRPVVASNVGGIPEVLRDGVTGVLVPPRDVNRLAEAIIRLAQDRQLCERMGLAGHQFVKDNYTWDRSLDMMSSLYDRLIDAKT
jgi:glycosyltransferase involved in cell wall biosynthesis